MHRFLLARGWIVSMTMTALGCGAPPAAAPPFAPDRVCPGSADCTTTGAGPFEAGVAVRVITPTIVETMTLDANGDALYNAADGDQFADVNGNGVFDAVWIAGYDNGRPANGVRDDLYARAVALRRGDFTMVVVAVDFVGYMYDEVERIRAALPASLGVDYLVVNATHDHEGPDTIGIWGPDPATTGLDLTYNAWVRDQIVSAVTEAVQTLTPAHVTYAHFPTSDYPGLGLANYVGDSRDPVVIDDRMTVWHFTRADTNAVIGTLVNWSAHVEYTGSHNNLLSSYYPHWLRQGVEQGLTVGTTTLPGVGGVCIFVNGSVGGQIGPSRVQAYDLAGVAHPSNGVDKAQANGENLAAYVLRALDPTSGMATTDTTMDLAFRNKVFYVPVKNRGYHTALALHLFDRSVYDYDATRPPSDSNVPSVRTEAAVLTLGRAEVVTCPGEIFPELFIGGYDGSHTGPIWPVEDLTRTNPPDLSQAPVGPYLVDRMHGQYHILFGLSNDELGYIVPTYDFELDPANPYYSEAPGSHYEETNSTGPDADRVIVGTMTALVEWQPPGR